MISLTALWLLLLFVLFTLLMERCWWPPCSSFLQVSLVTWFPNLLLCFYFLNKNKLQNVELAPNCPKVPPQGFRLGWDLLPVMFHGWSLDDLMFVCLLSLFMLQLLRWRVGWEDDVWGRTEFLLYNIWAGDGVLARFSPYTFTGTVSVCSLWIILTSAVFYEQCDPQLCCSVIYPLSSTNHLASMSF